MSLLIPACTYSGRLRLIADLQKQTFTASAWRLAKHSCNVLPLAYQMIAAIACCSVRDVLELKLLQLQTANHMGCSFTDLWYEYFEHQ